LRPCTVWSNSFDRLGTTEMARDGIYIVDLWDEILGQQGIKEYRFPFLVGDPGKSGRRTRLPVDVYYPRLKLVVEYDECQHSEAVPFFDRRIVASGITRGEQRKRYDRIRRDVLPQHGLSALVFSYGEFEHKKSKRLKRVASDREVIRGRLDHFLSTGRTAPHQ
jgi:hypothetical protein